ncbi:MAG: hypothetical protein GXP62_00390, partial [Oligoflexia bacterium]|nr:hypothetical protein [Oligoflexia bacterium]
VDSALGDRLLFVGGQEHLGNLLGEPSLDHVRETEIRALGGWLERRATVRLGVGLTDADVLRLECPLFEINNGAPLDVAPLWQRCGGDPELFRLSASWMALTDTRNPDELRVPAATDIRRAIIGVLPEDATKVLYAVTTHGGDLPHEVMGPLVGPRVPTDLLAKAGLLRRTAIGWRTTSDWTGWLHVETREDIEELHRGLAAAFRQLFVDASEPRCALHVLAAFRHHLEAGDVDQALSVARYAAPLLLAHARSLSIAARTPDAYARASRLYEVVLEEVERGRLRLPDPYVGYSRHYLHYNRAKAGLERIEETARGYARSTEEWPEHAMFWSRLIRSRFYQGRDSDALAALAEGGRRVPEHPMKREILIGRTVEGLLRHQPPLVGAAVAVWADFRPGSPRTRATARRLSRKLERGWEVQRLPTSGGLDVVFRRRQRVFILARRHDWLARVDALGLDATGTSPALAWLALGDAVRARAEELLAAYTHQMEPKDRFHKQLLLGVVDVLASRLGGLPTDTAWVVGQIETRDGALWLHDRSSGGGWYALHDGLKEPPVLDERPRLAKVRCDERGVPTGPVIEFDRPFDGDADELFAWWRSRIRDVG